MQKITLTGGWKVQALVDDDGHLNIFVSNDDRTDIVECETGQGDGLNGEALASRYSTKGIEEAYKTSMAPEEPLEERFEIGRCYFLNLLEKAANAAGVELSFCGEDLYHEGEPSEFLTINEMKFIWDGHMDASGAVYKRVS